MGLKKFGFCDKFRITLNVYLTTLLYVTRSYELNTSQSGNVRVIANHVAELD